MAASSIHCILTVSRDHIDEGQKSTNELPRVSFAKILKIRGCHAEKREESREKREERREKMAASSIHCIFIVSRDHLDEGRKSSQKKF